MIRVKVFKVREMLLKFVYYLIFLLLIYFLLIILLKLISFTQKSFDINMVEENIDLEEDFSRSSLNIKFLINELGIDDRMINSNSRNWVAENAEESSKTPQNLKDEKLKNKENQFLSYEHVKSQPRLNKYDVKVLSDNKIQVGKAFINNYSGLSLDLDELSKVSNFKIDDTINILIFHTHTSEAYEEAGVETNFHTTDNAYNVIAVGETLKENLLLKNFQVLHDITKHDTPSYNGAYNASLETVEKLFKSKKYDIVIDLHRDALSGNLHFRPTTEINGETASKLMFVIGTNGSGLQHDRWMNNLRLALLIQNTAEEMYPGLFRDLNLAKYRYNQHLSDGAFIIEVGSTGNTLSDTKTAMKYFANVLAALKN